MAHFSTWMRRFEDLSNNVIFGIGWGLSGQCPGSAVASLGTGNLPVILGIAAMFIGAYLWGFLDSRNRSE